MKIFAIGFNYPSHTREMKGVFTPRTGLSTQGAVSAASDSDFHEKEVMPFSDLQEPIFFMKPDTALLQRGRPFFLPDFSEEVHYEMEVV